jgi:LytR cell envelope-related transcriptional attenuator
MGAMNLSTGRIVVIVALIVLGLAVLANGFGSDSTAATASPSPSVSDAASPSGGPSVTESPQASPTPAPQTKGVLIMAMNGTDVTGAGAAAQTLLVDAGYKAPELAVDAPVQGVKKTTVYYRDDDNAAQNKADATYIADEYFGGAPVKPLDEGIDAAVPATVTVVVVVGDDYATQLTE